MSSTERKSIKGRQGIGKIITARILTKLVVFVAKGKTTHEPEFQLSSSNSLGDMSNFVTEIEDQKGYRFHHLFVKNLVFAEIA